MTPKQEAALRLAADAIDEFCELGAIIRPLEVRDAIREALAEPKEKYQYGTPLLDAMTGKFEQPAHVAAVNTSSERVDKTAKNVHEQPAQQQEPVAYDKTEINCFAQDLYDQKMREGKRGHYESMFHVIHQCIKKVSPPASKPLTDEMITAGARALCKQMAEACGVDAGDQWRFYADTFKEDAKAVLEAVHAKGDA